MLCNNSSDTFTFKINIYANRNFAKQDVHPQIALIYGSLGLRGPEIAKLKKIMQRF